MKLNKDLTQSSYDDEEVSFDIKDKSLIFDILRSKMYSNPILSICREISCNARDAHREVGKFDLPIEIYLPTSFDPYFKVKDFGPGISPDRMYNIFINYASSTKTNDNIQTGGFGLGAKTPFSYSDNFSIITNFNGIKYNYAAIIDETKVGKIILLSQSPTSDPNGTEIIIPVNNSDFSNFSYATEACIKHWKIQPIINKTLNITPTEYLFKNDHFMIEKVNDHYNDSIKIIIDDIEYKVPRYEIQKKIGNIFDGLTGCLCMYFNTGELTLSANREQLHFDQFTINALHKRANQVKKEIEELIVKEINKYDNLWDASCYWLFTIDKYFKLSWFTRVKWRDSNCNVLSRLILNASAISFTRNANKSKISKEYQTKCNKPISDNTALYIADLDFDVVMDLSSKNITELMNSNNKDKIIIIIPPENIDIDKFCEESGLLLMGVQKLSGINNLLLSKNKVKNNSMNRVVFYKFKKDKLTYTSQKEIKKDTKSKILCYFDGNSDNFVIILEGLFGIRKYHLSALQALYPDISIYALNSKFKDNVKDKFLLNIFSSYENCDDFIKSKICKTPTILMCKYLSILLRQAPSILSYINSNILSSINNKHSNFIKYIHLYAQACENDYSCLHLYEQIYGQISDQEINNWVMNTQDLINLDFHKKYPLLHFISKYDATAALPGVIEYINLIDTV
jgi:hypothetical protein